ncbi:MAG: cupin domain-containing protein [Pseudomonadota bacterium]
MPKIDIDAMDWKGGTGYPAPFADVTEGRFRKRLGNEVGLDQYGVNLTKLEPGAQSALRHWQEKEDEFVYILEGEPILIENDGETQLKPGDAAGFKAGVANGHHLVNRTDKPVLYLEIGSRLPAERVRYPDVDLFAEKTDAGYRFTKKDGSAY